MIHSIVPLRISKICATKLSIITLNTIVRIATLSIWIPNIPNITTIGIMILSVTTLSMSAPSITVIILCNVVLLNVVVST